MSSADRQYRKDLVIGLQSSERGPLIRHPRSPCNHTWHLERAHQRRFVCLVFVCHVGTDALHHCDELN
jgi:hypothetical protein